VFKEMGGPAGVQRADGADSVPGGDQRRLRNGLPPGRHVAGG